MIVSKKPVRTESSKYTLDFRIKSCINVPQCFVGYRSDRVFPVSKKKIQTLKGSILLVGTLPS